MIPLPTEHSPLAGAPLHDDRLAIRRRSWLHASGPPLAGAERPRTSTGGLQNASPAGSGNPAREGAVSEKLNARDRSTPVNASEFHHESYDRSGLMGRRRNV
jgi:hypothetical protein